MNKKVDNAHGCVIIFLEESWKGEGIYINMQKFN